MVFRAFSAVALTAGLLVFLAGLRLAQKPEEPDQTIRTLSTVDPVALPAPPPPPPAEVEPPPPPPEENLPKLELALDSVAPPVKARIERDIEMNLPRTDFAKRDAPSRARMVFTLSDLDSKPKIISRPNFSRFPKSLSEQGVKEGKVKLEVYITSTGTIRVRRMVDCTHEELVEIARSIASKSRFTPPQKDAREVESVFYWTLVIRDSEQS